MTKKNKKKQLFYVVRDMWDGRFNGEGSLLHGPEDLWFDGRPKDINPVEMCCLGHVCLQQKPSHIGKIVNTGLPSLDEWPNFPLSMFFRAKAAEINDDSALTPQEKEESLIALFRDNEIELKFVDTIHNVPNNVRKMYTRVKIFITGKYR